MENVASTVRGKMTRFQLVIYCPRNVTARDFCRVYILFLKFMKIMLRSSKIRSPGSVLLVSILFSFTSAQCLPGLSYSLGDDESPNACA